MSKKSVRRKIDPSRPPPLTRAQKAELARLREASDDDIDTSDIPELTETFWSNAVRNPFYRPIKKQLTLRLDADVVAWFRQHAGGGGYQTDINRALREHIERQEKKAG